MIKEFSQKYSTKTRRDDEGFLIIPGKKKDAHVYEYSETLLAAMCLFDSPRSWGFAKKTAENAGCVIRQDGDREGAFTFDPNNDAQARTALKLIDYRKKRVMTEEQKQAQSERIKQFRYAQEGHAHGQIQAGRDWGY